MRGEKSFSPSQRLGSLQSLCLGFPNTAFSAKIEVTSGADIVAERAMYFNYSGRVGGHETIGFCGDTILDRCYLAEGYTGGNFDTYILLSNPSDTTDATAKVTYMKQDGTTKEETYSVPKHSRYTIHVDEISGFSDASFGATIEGTTGRVLAERAMYFNYNGKDGGHATIATPADTAEGPGTEANWMGPDWYFSEGYTGGNFDTWLLFFNPDSTTDAQVMVTFVKPDGTTKVLSPTVPKHSRYTIHVDEVDGMGDMSFGTKAEVTAPPNIVAERAMYFDYPIP